MQTISPPTLRVRRSNERGFDDFSWTDNYLTFSFGGYRDPVRNNFGPLRVMIENHIQPRSGFPSHSHRDAEIVTYVASGTLIPDRRGTEAAYHQLKFEPEERQGRFRPYISRNGEDGNMPINTDARIYAGLFRAGDSVRHSLPTGWGAWIQVVHGDLRVAGLALHQRDGVGITDAHELDIQFASDSEVLLFDLGMDAPLLWR